jgi:hypothetical protein
MLTLGFFFSNLIILGAWILFVATLRDRVPGDIAPYAGLLMGSQIVLSEILLGTLGSLYFSWVVGVNLAVSIAVIMWLYFSGRLPAWQGIRPSLKTLTASAHNFTGWENLMLAVLLGFLTVWFCIAIYFLPPRGIDDLVYHLPPLYEYVQSHQISLLPLELRYNFAMPSGGDFLFLWPLIFFHDDWMIDSVQFVVGLFGITALYGLARCFSVPRRDALFVSLLFPFTPLVLGQAGSNYVDLIVAVCHLVLLYACVRFWQTGNLSHLVFAGIASGFGLGVKYNLIPAVVAVQAIILSRFWRDKSFTGALRRYAIYILSAVPLCLYWYVRSYMETGHALYPYSILLPDSNPFDPDFTGMYGLRRLPEAISASYGTGVGPAFWRFLAGPGQFVEYVFRDPGLGSLHGGLGPVFWGLGFPAMTYCGYRSIRSMMKKDFFPAFFWGQAVMTVVVYLLQQDITRLVYNQRLIVVVVGFGLIALGIVLQKLRLEAPRSLLIIKFFCVGASILSVIHLAGYAMPTYQIKPAVTDWAEDRQTSDYKYLRDALNGTAYLSMAWEPLDFLTKGGPGWDVYMAVRWDSFWTAPTFGTQAQNRVWNFSDAPPDEPDAFIFYYDRPYGEIFFLGKKITPAEVASKEHYELVTLAPFTEFWVKSELLEQPEIRARQIQYYRRIFDDAIQLLEPIIDEFPNDGILITSSPLGHAFKYLSLTGALKIPVKMIPDGQERSAINMSRGKTIISVNKPLEGFASRPLTELRARGFVVRFFENTLP